MPSSKLRGTCMLALMLISALPQLAVAGDPVTTWSGGTSGDWSDATWSAGEPTAAQTAVVGSQVSLGIVQAGEVCANLYVADGSEGAAITMAAGTLDVGNELRLGDPLGTGVATFSQLNGTVTGTTLTLERGGYIMGGVSSSAEFGTCTLLGGTVSSLSTSGGSFTVTGDMTIALGAFVNAGGGMFRVGTSTQDALIVRGIFGINNATGSITLENLTLDTDSANLSVGIGTLGVQTATVTGTFTRNGSLTVNDIGAADGRYDVLTAGTIVGDFDATPLPPGWTWGLDGNTLWVEKGSGMPVEDISWGSLKHGFPE